MKVIVCGDSYMTAAPSTPGKHFSEILVKKLSSELKIYARGGMSNAGIALQIESAARSDADLVIVNTTWCDRMEIQYDLDSGNFDFDVNSVLYTHPQSISTDDPELNQQPRLIIDTIHYFLDRITAFAKYDDVVPDLKRNKYAVRNYFSYMYKTDWKTKQDRWALYSALHQLDMSKIPYVVILDAIGIKDTCAWLNERNYIDNFESFQLAYNARLDQHKKSEIANSKTSVKWEDPGYHTLPEDQVNMCEQILEHIRKYELLAV
jgi:hypothetical protein